VYQKAEIGIFEKNKTEIKIDLVSRRHG